MIVFYYRNWKLIQNDGVYNPQSTKKIMSSMFPRSLFQSLQIILDLASEEVVGADLAGGSEEVVGADLAGGRESPNTDTI